MIEGIEDKYSELAGHILEALPEGWQHATLYAVFYERVIDFCGDYADENGELRSFPTPMKLGRVVKEMRELFRQANQPLWGQATFTIQSNGTFSMKWGYDNCDANGDTIYDAAAWNQKKADRRKRLGMPYVSDE